MNNLEKNFPDTLTTVFQAKIKLQVNSASGVLRVFKVVSQIVCLLDRMIYRVLIQPESMAR